MAAPFQCPVCKGKVDGRHIDLHGGVVRCPTCGRISRDVEPAGKTAPRAPVTLPGRFRMWESGDRLIIAIRWFRPLLLVPVGLVAAFDLGMFKFYSWMDTQGFQGLDFVMFPLAYNAAAVLATYWALALLLNRTHVTVERGRITVSQVPLPCRRKKVIPAEDVAQLFCRAEQGDYGQVRYHVCVLRPNGRWVKLVRKLPTAAEALFIEEAVERQLGIKDEAVAGEVRRP